MSFSVTTNMVNRFDITEACCESYPPRHKCTLTLTDGREATVHLKHDEISTLIQEIAKEKINYLSYQVVLDPSYQPPEDRIVAPSFSSDHFSDSDSPSSNAGKAKEILTRIFSSR